MARNLRILIIMSAKFGTSSVVFACAIAASGCSPLALVSGLQQIRGSGVSHEEMRSVSGDFRKITEDGAANLFVTVGPSTTVKVEGDDNIVPLVETKVVKGTLVIKTKHNFRPKKKLLVTVTVPELNEVQLDGAGNVTVRNVQSRDFQVGWDGAGNVTLSGRTGSLRASLDGAGNLKMYDLKAASADTSVDGAGNIQVWATDHLKASIDGVGNISYKGHPRVDKSVGGVGRVHSAD